MRIVFWRWCIQRRLEIQIEPSLLDRTSITHSEGAGGSEGRVWGSWGYSDATRKKVGSPAEKSFLRISESFLAPHLLRTALLWLLSLPHSPGASVPSPPFWGSPHCSVPWGSLSSLAVAGHPGSPASLLCCLPKPARNPLFPKRSSAGTPGARSRGDKDPTRQEAVAQAPCGSWLLSSLGVPKA